MNWKKNYYVEWIQSNGQVDKGYFENEDAAKMWCVIVCVSSNVGKIKLYHRVRILGIPFGWCRIQTHTWNYT